MSSKRYFLIDSDGYLYTIPKWDLITPDPSLVEVNQSVSFKYGSLTTQGVVIKISSKESSILSEMKKIKNTKKAELRSESFHDDRPRAAALKSREMLSSIKPQAASNTENKRKKASSHKVEVKKLKLAAERETDSVKDDSPKDSAIPLSRSGTGVAASGGASHPNPVVVEKQEEKDVLSDDVQEGSPHSSSSGSSSIEPVSKTKQVLGKRKDLDALNDLKTSSSEEDLNVKEDSKPTATTSNGEGDKHCREQESVSISNVPLLEVVPRDTLKCKGEESVSLQEGEAAHSKDEGKHEISEKHKSKSKRRKRRKRSTKAKKRQSKKFKSRRRRYSSSSSDSSSSSSSSSPSSSSSSEATTSSSDESSKPRKRKRAAIVKRNVQVFEGVNYLHNKNDQGVVPLHGKFNVYVKEDELSSTLNSAKSVTMFIRNMVDKIYTEDALRNCTPQGYPARSKGKDMLQKEDTKCRLHPEGRDALLKRAIELENERKSWRPRVGINAMKQAFSGRCSELRA